MRLNFRGKVEAAGAMIRDLRRRSWVAPEQMVGIAEYLPELRAVVKMNRELLAAGSPTARFPVVQLETGAVTLVTLDALEIVLSGMSAGARAESLKREIAQRRRAIRRDGFDTLLRAALVRKYGLRIQEAS